MKLFINEKLTVEGNFDAFTNPVIEAGVIHCRSMLEFLGLAMNKTGAIASLAKPRRSDDIGIESFSNMNGPLPWVTPTQATSRYFGGAAEAEQALLAVFRIANKGLAHLKGVRGRRWILCIRCAQASLQRGRNQRERKLVSVPAWHPH